MQVSFQKAFSFFITGSTKPPEIDTLEKFNPSNEQLEEWETTREEWELTQKNSLQFKNSVLSLHTNWESGTGYFRNSALSVFDSLFSGVGAGISSKINFAGGLGLVAASILASAVSTVKKLPFISSNFAFDNYGGRLIRSVLHVFDSTFSRIGEKGAKYKAPGILAGLLGLFTLNRVLQNKDSDSIKIPYGTIGGTVGRTAMHHAESMLASEANKLSNSSPSLSAFIATSSSTLGLLLPENIKDKNIPVETLEGLSAQFIPHFLDSLFSNIGNAFSSTLNKPKNLLLASAGFLGTLPILSLFTKFWNHKASMPSFSGKLIRSAFNVPDAVAFNAGNHVGNSILGIPLSLGFLGLTYLSCVSKKYSGKFKNIKIPLNTVGSLFQRLPFGFLYAMTSSAGAKLSNFIPAPILTLVGPALSFKIGEQFKGVDAKYDDLKGLMIRNATHLWEAVLAKAAFKTGKMLTGQVDNSHLSGSLFGERWITDDGQIVQNMAMGKQMNNHEEKNIFHILLSGLGGIGFALGAYALGKYFMKSKPEPLKNESTQAVAVEAYRGKPFAGSTVQQSAHIRKAA